MRPKLTLMHAERLAGVFLLLLLVSSAELPSSTPDHADAMSSLNLRPASRDTKLSVTRILPFARQQHLYTMLVRDALSPTSSSVETAFGNTLEVMQLITNNTRLKSVFYCSVRTTVFDLIGGATAQESIFMYQSSHKLDMILGVIPSALQDAGDVMITDPINTTTTTRRENPFVVYLFATLEEQLYVAAGGIADSNKGLGEVMDVRVVLRQQAGADVEAILGAVELAFGHFDVPIDVIVMSATDSLSDGLHPARTNLVLGLSSEDAQAVVSFLVAFPKARVVLNFDELTLLYAAILAVYHNAYHVSMERLLYATNLPRWIHAPTHQRSSTLTLFFDLTTAPSRTPAALRTYLTALLMDALAYRISRTYTRDNLPKELYTDEVFTLDYDISFGPFANTCSFPSLDHASCLVNYGARDVALWTLASAFKPSLRPYFGPVSRHWLIEHGGFGREVEPKGHNYFLVSMVGVIVALAVGTFGLMYASALGYFQGIDEVVTIVHVTVVKVRGDVQHVSDALGEYSARVDELVRQHECLEVEATEKGFVVVSRRPSAAVALALELQLSLLDICQRFECEGAVMLQMGVHTARCPLGDALDDEDRFALLPAIASAAVLAACVAALVKESAVLVTRWTLDGLQKTTGVRVQAFYAGTYQLDDEGQLIEVYAVHSLSIPFRRTLSFANERLLTNPLLGDEFSSIVKPVVEL